MTLPSPPRETARSLPISSTGITRTSRMHLPPGSRIYRGGSPRVGEAAPGAWGPGAVSWEKQLKEPARAHSEERRPRRSCLETWEQKHTRRGREAPRQGGAGVEGEPRGASPGPPARCASSVLGASLGPHNIFHVGVLPARTLPWIPFPARSNVNFFTQFTPPSDPGTLSTRQSLFSLGPSINPGRSSAEPAHLLPVPVGSLWREFWLTPNTL